VNGAVQDSENNPSTLLTAHQCDAPSSTLEISLFALAVC
jgi:hypothetical protein